MALRSKAGEATPRSCPDDQLNLKKIRYHGITLDLCQECCGVWFDRKDLDALHQHRRALGIGGDGLVPVYVKREDSEASWDDSLIHFILFAARD
jgi:Zn-finger nucleic acid-binding protein